jgi:anti-sigma B factor antagonist
MGRFEKVRRKIMPVLSYRYRTRQVGDVTVLDIGRQFDPDARLSFGGAGHSLKDLIRDFAAAGQTKIVLNLSDAPYIDSAGIGEFVSSATILRRQGGDLKVVNLSTAVQKVLQMAKVDTWLDVKPDEASALEAFADV